MFAVLILAGIFVAAWLRQGALNWLIVAVGLTLFLGVVGAHVTGRPAGALINERNLMSLSRFQMILWTIIVLSGFFTIAIGRIKAGVADPLAITMDWRLWALMGISTASLVGSPLVLSPKKNKEPSADTVPTIAHELQESPAAIEANREGILYKNSTTTDASFMDMFQGDELQNTGHLDLAKLQMFIFTVIAATAYSATLWKMFSDAQKASGDVTVMPGLSEGLIALIGISHAGYLSSKGLEHTKTVS